MQCEVVYIYKCTVFYLERLCLSVLLIWHVCVYQHNKKYWQQTS